MGEITPMADALAVWAEEGRVYERENIDESSNRHYQSMISEWGNPLCSNTWNPAVYCEDGNPGNWNI